MGSWSGTGLSGSGHASTGATAPYTDISVTVTSLAGRTRLIGTNPLEIQHAKYAGSYGLGCFADDAWGCSPPAVLAWELIQFISQDYAVQPRWGSVSAPSIWWALMPGVTVDIGVSW